MGLHNEVPPLFVDGPLYRAIPRDGIRDRKHRRTKKLISNTDVLFAAPLNLLSGELREGELVELPFYEPWMVTNYGFITLKNHSTTPTVEKFMEEICAIEKELFIEEQALAATCLEKKR